jgi:cell division protein FtsN
MTLSRQQGGTILGIIIGLVIGLGIALTVAIVITKTPMPFMDKSGKQKAGAPTAGQSADPNKPLYGNKGAIKEAAKDFVKEPPTNTATPVTTAQPAETKVGKQVEARQDGKAPVVEQSTAADKAKKPEAGEARDAGKGDEDKFIYFLQAGAFREQADAEGIRAKLAMLGVEARISERQSENGVLYRVRAGPFGQLDAMNKVRGKLSDNGIDAAVIRVAK